MPSSRSTSAWRTRRVALAAGLLAVAAPLAAAGPAAASPNKIGPDQTFGGVINGQDGLGGTPTIQMACFGPQTPGETGHPLKGQTIGVFRPEAIQGPWGFTGPAAHEISVFFGAPPPNGTPPTPGRVTFQRYQTKKLPTTLVLPCAGTETVFFVPLPLVPPTTQPFSMTVRFAPQP